MLADVELRELRIFLALADELHFGQTAGRLGVSQPTVSEAIRLLERRLGTRLFDRTSRRVTLTPAGAELRQRLAPILDHLDRALGDTRDYATGIAGVLRVGTAYTTFLPPALELSGAFSARYPRCGIDYVSIDTYDPYPALRRGQVDVLLNWLAVDEPDLTAGPAIAHYERVLVAGRGHRLAKQASVSVEELAEEEVNRPPASFPPALRDAILPPRTPSGRAIRRATIGQQSGDAAWSLGAVLAAVANGELVHVTMRGVPTFEHRDLVLVPIHDLPRMPLGLIWRTATEDAKILALAEVARANGPWPADAPRSAPGR
jgi:DNA-binding transcriptional LysR family regulator